MVVPVQNPAVMGYFEPAVMGYSDVVSLSITCTRLSSLMMVLEMLVGTI